MPTESLYLSQLLESRVMDAAGARVGLVADAVVRPGDLFPSVVALVVRRTGAPSLRVPWSAVGEVRVRGVALRARTGEVSEYTLQEGDILLRVEVLDKQLVDTHDRRVVKVNDLKLVLVRGELRVVGVDIGGRGILRRLGLEGASERAWRLAGRTLSEALIPWNYVESVPARGANVRLSVPSSRLAHLHPADISRIISQLPAEERAAAAEHFSDETLAEAMGDLDASTQSSIMEGLGNERASDILERMAPDEATDLLQDLSEERQAELLTLMESDEAQALTHLLGYDEHSAGGLMTTEFIALRDDLTAQEAIARVREVAPDAETVYYLYVVDGEGRLMGVLSLFRLITSLPERPIRESMTTAVVSVPAGMDQEHVAGVIAKYRLLAVPVVDATGKLLGIVTVHDTIDVVDEEAAEDLSHMAGTPTGSAEALESGGSVALSRMPWVLIALVAGLFAASALHSLAGARLPQAVLFLPVLLLLGNQVAARAATAIARGIALREVDRANWWSRSSVEVRAAAPAALAGAVVAGAAAGLWGGLPWGLAVGISAVAIMLGGSILGMLVPLAEAALQLDPAYALRPIVVSLLAVVGPVIYAGFLRLFVG